VNSRGDVDIADTGEAIMPPVAAPVLGASSRLGSDGSESLMLKTRFLVERLLPRREHELLPQSLHLIDLSLST